jgi:hypothetical protein
VSVNDLSYLKEEGRWGMILIQDKYLLDSRVRAFLGQCIIFRAEFLWSSKAVKYEILHPDLPASSLWDAVENKRVRVYETADGKVRLCSGSEPLPKDVTEFTC